MLGFPDRFEKEEGVREPVKVRVRANTDESERCNCGWQFRRVARVEYEDGDYQDLIYFCWKCDQLRH